MVILFFVGCDSSAINPLWSYVDIKRTFFMYLHRKFKNNMYFHYQYTDLTIWAIVSIAEATCNASNASR